MKLNKPTAFIPFVITIVDVAEIANASKKSNTNQYP